jgi:leucyl-tRNA synthetase
MDTFLDTAWYYLRCMNPDYPDSLCDPEALARWGQADLYVGGIEICVPIMLYGSFVAKGLRDAGHIDFSVPCGRLLAHDMVLSGGRKMSKSLGNTVDPEELVDEVGADSVRLLILSLAPPLKKIEWSDSRLRGCHRFLRRLWNLVARQAGRASCGGDSAARSPTETALAREVNEAVRLVSEEMEQLQPNTCIMTLIKLLYRLEQLENRPDGDGVVLAERPVYREALRDLLLLLSPFAPHICEELAERLGHTQPLSRARWPVYDDALSAVATEQITVKVNAKPVARL